MTDIITWFTNNIISIFVSLINSIINYIINPLISAIAALFSTAANLLPTYSPNIPKISSIVGADFMGHLNWFLPIGSFVIGWGIIVVSVTARFVVAPALRWFKLTQ